MDHSVWAYIKRLPTEKLEAFLQQYYSHELTEDFSYIVPYMENELKQRRQNE